ncbi:MAG: 50S ribosomal protein L32 [Gammaproteobacteria bacterium]|nr:50S ribosomal protein L32 [Gammaproteobacteria bacterium]
MAVQKSRRSRSTRGMRRSHDKLSASTLSIEVESGEVHKRHHISPKGYYKGRQIVVPRVKKSVNEDELNANTEATG